MSLQYRIESKTITGVANNGPWLPVDSEALAPFERSIFGRVIRFRKAADCNSWSPFWVDDEKTMCIKIEGHDGPHLASEDGPRVEWIDARSTSEEV